MDAAVDVVGPVATAAPAEGATAAADPVAVAPLAIAKWRVSRTQPLSAAPVVASVGAPAAGPSARTVGDTGPVVAVENDPCGDVTKVVLFRE